jgi:threonylcarbamoyladenosine tRNA methylthiotransferase MtaB
MGGNATKAGVARMKASFITLGCKVNHYDTQAMMALFEDAGYALVDFPDKADVYIVNTCTVTNMSDRKSRQMISKAHAANPEGLIVVTGCYVQRAAGEALKLPGVQLVIGTKDRENIVQLVETALRGGKTVNAVSNIAAERAFEKLTIKADERTRAYVKIEDGCNNFCAYCIIPYVRGRVRSRPLEDIAAQLRTLAQNGYEEVVLTGISLDSYGLDICSSLNEVIRIACAQEGIARIRLGSLDPCAITDEFAALASASTKMCRQFHISLQSGSAGVLKRMNRKYSPEAYAECAARLRSVIPDVAITTDIIVGFPGETDEEFEETMRFVKDVAFARLHVFQYSPRQGTVAASMPGQIDSKLKAERAAMLGRLGKTLEKNYMQRFIGHTLDVLFEEAGQEGYMKGHTATYIMVQAPAHERIIGKILPVKIEKLQALGLIGSII